MLAFIENFNSYCNKNGDPRVSNWFLLSNPFYTIGIILSYVVTVKILGPKFMKNRAPWKLKNTILVYNLIQVLLSSWIVYEYSMSGWLTGEYNLSCQPLDWTTKPNTLRMLGASRIYFYAKFTELLDTVFFVLKKSFRQISILHLWHHGIMPISIYFGLKFGGGVGHGTFLALVNSMVHVIMYSYYFLSACGPQLQPYLWWKKYITVMQMFQFIAVLLHSLQLLFVPCDFPKLFVYIILSHSAIFYFLFKNFYQQSYKPKKLV